MTAVFQLLYNTISDDGASTSANAWQHTVFFQAASATEKLLGWTFTRFDPFTSTAWQQQSRSQNEESVMAHGVDEDDEPSSTSSASAGKKTLRPQHVPDTFVPVLLSDDVVSLLATAYRFGLRLQANGVASRDISFSVHRLRQCILSTCSFTPQAQKPQHVPVLVSRTKHLCATLQSLVDEESAAPSQVLSARGNSMLFLAQAFQIVVSVVPLQILAASLQLGDSGAQGSFAFISSLSTLGKAIFGLAFHRPKDTDEEDDLVVLTEDTVDVLLACWQALTSSWRQQDASHAQTPMSRSLHALFMVASVTKSLALTSLGVSKQRPSWTEKTKCPKSRRSPQRTVTSTQINSSPLPISQERPRPTTFVHYINWLSPFATSSLPNHSDRPTSRTSS